MLTKQGRTPVFAIATITVVTTAILGTSTSWADPLLSSRTTAQSTIDEALNRLSAAPLVATGYIYKNFAIPAVNRIDARGCNKRDRVLIASAKSAPRVGPGCSLIGGSWQVNQGAKTVDNAAKVDVVPLVSEKSVWTQGGFGWTNDQRTSFLKWQQSPKSECAITKGTKSLSSCQFVLELKGTGGRNASVTDVMSQTQWNLNCAEAAGIVQTLSNWGLAIDPAAKKRIQNSNCGATTVAITSLNVRNPIPAAEVGNPFLASGTANRNWNTTDVLDAPAGPAISPAFFGLHVPEPQGAQPTVEYTWLRLWDAKTGWEPLEQNKGTYYWKTLDDAISYAEAKGKQVLYVFGDTPAWAGPSPSAPPTDIEEFKRFANAVISRYGNRIDAYEVWNEPNLYNPVTTKVADLLQMTKYVYDTVKKVSPSSLVLTPSTTMRTDTVTSSFYSQYLSQLGKIGWPIDGYAFHTYPRAAGGPAERANAIAQFKQMLVLAQAPRKPIWDSERNYGLGGLQEAKRNIDGADAQGYLSQTFIDSVRLGVEYVDWYLWFPRYFDLLGIQLNPTTVATNKAWEWTYQQLVGASLTACGSQGDSIVCGFQKNGTKYVLAYSSTGIPTSVDMPNTLKTFCDIEGVCKPVQNGKVTVDIKPVRVS